MRILLLILLFIHTTTKRLYSYFIILYSIRWFTVLVSLANCEYMSRRTCVEYQNFRIQWSALIGFHWNWVSYYVHRASQQNTQRTINMSSAHFHTCNMLLNWDIFQRQRKRMKSTLIGHQLTWNRWALFFSVLCLSFVLDEILFLEKQYAIFFSPSVALAHPKNSQNDFLGRQRMKKKTALIIKIPHNEDRAIAA